jgi:hypothetical protein
MFINWNLTFKLTFYIINNIIYTHIKIIIILLKLWFIINQDFILQFLNQIQVSRCGRYIIYLLLC